MSDRKAEMLIFMRNNLIPKLNKQALGDMNLLISILPLSFCTLRFLYSSPCKAHKISLCFPEQKAKLQGPHL